MPGNVHNKTPNDNEPAADQSFKKKRPIKQVTSRLIRPALNSDGFGVNAGGLLGTAQGEHFAPSKFARQYNEDVLFMQR